MNNKEEFSEIEKDLFEHFEKKRKTDIPLSTQYTIQNAFNQKQRKTMETSIPQIVLYLFSILILTTGVVFAKDIVHIIESLFNNSTNSIDTAVQNGYVQNVNMDFVYDNNIGIKVDYIMKDNTNLDISYVYNCNNDIVVDYIELNQYTIKDDNNNLLYQYDSKNSILETPSNVTSMKKNNDMIKIRNNILKQSILYTSNDFPNSKILFISIDSLKINNEMVVEGSWNFEIVLDNKFMQEPNIIYQPISNKHIIQSEITLSETKLSIFLEIDENYNDILMLENKPTLRNNFDESYDCKTWNSKNFENSSQHFLEFNVSKYDENINILFLELTIDENKSIEIQLDKQQ